ncbi:hypothetical protein NP233_g12968 [Leucocoprinus birnbaumii]|uniref:Uncharacterized protein n=1 Tax=Leucocoprinus birnbaumii TaxID=56174 RepID=A0AAD5VDP9_9AGAR|nr:hypothetical protein NP233_g12968 [Leucocoprinus birnbaumii]
MTTSTFSGPPTFSDSDKFDGTNWIAFKNMITIAAKVRGAMGYLTGDIRDPTTLIKSSPETTETSTKTATAADPEDTAWDSETPSASEWRKRNAWAKGLLLYNIRNPIGLGANIAGNAAEVWKSLKDLYDKTSELARLHAEEQLRSLRL